MVTWNLLAIIFGEIPFAIWLQELQCIGNVQVNFVELYFKNKS